MATKLGRKELPAGHSAADFKYMGRPAKDQGDFGPDVGIADMACVNQFGQSTNNAKLYSGGVVQSTKTGCWFVYLEWGRIFVGKSWNGHFAGQDFQFVECSGESDARDFFAKQMASKNTKRGQWIDVAGVRVWAAKAGEDGYVVQDLAMREKGLPDAYTIKDSTGIVPKVAPTVSSPATKTKTVKVSKSFHPEVIRLAQSLVGGTKTYTRALSAAAGVSPTMASITQVRDSLIPAALQRIQVVGNDVARQVQDSGLVAVSKMVSALVPRPIPRSGITAEEAILNSGNIQRLEMDLDAFEASLRGEDFSVTTSTPEVDPDSLLNAQLAWMDPRGDGAEIIRTLLRMTNNRHSYLPGPMKVMNLFNVVRPDRDAKFLQQVRAVGAKRQGQFTLRANLQPAVRTDLTTEESGLYQQANVIFVQHGTRSVNVQPIVSTHFRKPQSLSGVPIAGANFGTGGTYLATDYRKAVGYTSYERSAWGNGGGAIQGRGAFMFLCDTIMGDAYRAPSTGSWSSPPNGKDSIFGVGGDRGHGLLNDEHVVQEMFYNRIRYLVEFTF